MDACSPAATLSMAAREMEAHIGSLVVTDDKEKIVGIVTDRDLAPYLAHGRTAATTVAEIMSRNVVTIPDDADIDAAAAARGLRRLPMADEHGRAIGMIWLDDLYNYLNQETFTLAGAVRARGAPKREMRVEIGDRIVLRGCHLGENERRGVALAVEGADGGPSYLVRWDGDEHESMPSPGSDAHVEHYPGSRASI